MIFLQEKHCRSGMTVTTASGAKVACTCERIAADCKQHAQKRRDGRTQRFESGGYPKVTGSQGGTTHGQVGGQFLNAVEFAKPVEEDIAQLNEAMKL
mmetsp:Transcript_23870/g.36271  ORF Transcript_23870/g.36271 Transcript_23870/m.36271 type:complete len:97 (+) Transcript_23870:857-1147(+)